MLGSCSASLFVSVVSSNELNHGGGGGGGEGGGEGLGGDEGGGGEGEGGGGAGWSGGGLGLGGRPGGRRTSHASMWGDSAGWCAHHPSSWHHRSAACAAVSVWLV